MNVLFALIVVHLATNIIAKKEKNKDDEHAIMHITVPLINMHKKNKKKKYNSSYVIVCLSSNKQ